MLRAVIFDFDGVITDSEILHFRAFNTVLAPHGFELSKREYYKDYLGLSDKDCFKALIGEGRLPIQESQVPTLIQQKTQVFEHLARTEGRIIEGVREFLALLGRAGVPIAICSGALRPEIELILEGAALRGHFDVIVSAEEVRRGKPDPEGFLLALQKLNHVWPDPIAPECCVVIEDSHWGLQAARAAGMHTIAVTNTYDAAQLKQADKVVHRLDDLTLDDLRGICS
ncbi:MAG TPA: HAD family phosphatase [Sedimentisphaerales bacterium]|jgi:beta-phosphoglucomutase|nr:HAD family phosphatase [Sedimentisphaerales bacterium]HNU30939.1 HAD family phosphatase [Sedimentisphaerales bacterium]